MIQLTYEAHVNSLLAAAMVKAMTKAGELQPKTEYTPRGVNTKEARYLNPISLRSKRGFHLCKVHWLVIIVTGQEGARNALGARSDINEVVSQKQACILISDVSSLP